MAQQLPRELGPVKTWSIVAGAMVGVLLSVLPVLFPARRHLFPSPAGIGLAWTFHWYYAFLFFLGAVAAWWIERRWPRAAEELTFPVASGWIAGESLMGVGLVLWEHAGDLVHRLFAR